MPQFKMVEYACPGGHVFESLEEAAEVPQQKECQRCADDGCASLAQLAISAPGHIEVKFGPGFIANVD